MVNPTKNYTDKFIIDCGDSVSYRLEIRRIIVPFDSSEFSANALDYAVYFANTIFKGNPKRQKIRIIILHVIQELPLTKSVLDKMTSLHKDEKTQSLGKCITSVYQGIRNWIEGDIIEKIQTYKHIEGIKIEYSILFGDPSNKIIEYVNNNMVDMIIIGSNGLHGLAKIKALGSVSRKVSESVQCPIVIIR
jgi:nucleotide-binding universal stress UspA family protein